METIRTKVNKNKFSINPMIIISSIYYMLGMLKMSNYKYANAIKFFEKAIKINSNSPFIDLCYKYLGISLIDNRQYEDGNRYLQKAMRMQKEEEYDSEIYSRLGWLYYLKKDYVAAELNFKKALEKYKKNDFVNVDSIKHNLEQIDRLKQ